MGSVPAVIGFILTDRGETRPPLPKAGFVWVGDDPLGHIDNYSAAVSDLPQLEAAAAGNGFLNQSVDWDQVVRRVPLILRLGEKAYPSLVAETLRVALGASTYVGRAAGANGEQSFGEKTGLTAIRIGSLTIPTDAAGRVWLHYAKLVDHIVLVGTSAEGVVNDLQATPIARDVPGVEIHAQLLEQILGGALLVRPDWAVGAEILFTLLVGLGLILALPRIGALLSAVLGGASVAIAFGASWLLFRHAQLLIDPVFPWAVMTLVYLVASLLGYLRTEARQREIRGAFSHYMSPHYVDELAAQPERLKLGG
jgi:adenylate cyclase